MGDATLTYPPPTNWNTWCSLVYTSDTISSGATHGAATRRRLCTHWL